MRKVICGSSCIVVPERSWHVRCPVSSRLPVYAADDASVRREGLSSEAGRAYPMVRRGRLTHRMVMWVMQVIRSRCRQAPVTQECLTGSQVNTVRPVPYRRKTVSVAKTHLRHTKRMPLPLCAVQRRGL